mgnify:CR=1 FL=1
MWGILGVFLQAAAGQILYLALHLESGSFPRPLSPAAERAAFAALRTGGAAGRDARDQLVRHNLRLVAHVCKKYYAATSNQDDLISIGTIGLIKAVDTFDPARASKFASYASRCIENELRMELRKIRREGAAVSLQEPLESGSGQLTLADTLPDDAEPLPDDAWQQMVYRWGDCPVLAGLELGQYDGYTLMDDLAGDNQDVLANLYIGARGVWDDKNADKFAAGEALWRQLTAGAAAE